MKAAVLVVLVVAYLHVGDALKCYVCTDMKWSDCKKDDNLKACDKKCMKVEMVMQKDVEADDRIAKRSCATADSTVGCKQAGDGSAEKETCYCDDPDGCNSGHTLSPPSILGLTLLLAAARSFML